MSRRNDLQTFVPSGLMIKPSYFNIKSLKHDYASNS